MHENADPDRSHEESSSVAELWRGSTHQLERIFIEENPGFIPASPYPH